MLRGNSLCVASEIGGAAAAVGVVLAVAVDITGLCGCWYPVDVVKATGAPLYARSLHLLYFSRNGASTIVTVGYTCILVRCSFGGVIVPSSCRLRKAVPGNHYRPSDRREVRGETGTE